MVIIRPVESEVLKTVSKVLSSVGRGLGLRFLIERIIKVLLPQTRKNRTIKNKAFRRSEAFVGSFFQIIRPSPNADITVDIPAPKTCNLIKLEVIAATYKFNLRLLHTLIKY
jgi:hypothetical protein